MLDVRAQARRAPRLDLAARGRAAAADDHHVVLHLVAFDCGAHSAILLRLHPDRPVEADRLAVEVVVVDDGERQLGVLLGTRQALREGHPGGQAGPDLFQRPKPTTGCSS